MLSTLYFCNPGKIYVHKTTHASSWEKLDSPVDEWFNNPVSQLNELESSEETKYSMTKNVQEL
jgi:hypothetical protein